MGRFVCTALGTGIFNMVWTAKPRAPLQNIILYVMVPCIRVQLSVSIAGTISRLLYVVQIWNFLLLLFILILPPDAKKDYASAGLTQQEMLQRTCGKGNAPCKISARIRFFGSIKDGSRMRGDCTNRWSLNPALPSPLSPLHPSFQPLCWSPWENEDILSLPPIPISPAKNTRSGSINQRYQTRAVYSSKWLNLRTMGM